jgi:hypothetical protein
MTSMQATRQELVKARGHVDDVLAAMDQLGSAPAASLPWVYKVFTDQVSQTVRQSGIARRRTSQMLTQWRQYIAIEKRSAGSPRPSCRPGPPSAAGRFSRTMIAAWAGAMEQAYPPFLTQLRDIQKALSLDLTPPGVRVVQPEFEDAHKSGADLKQAIANFMAEIDQVMAVSPPRK